VGAEALSRHPLDLEGFGRALESVRSSPDPQYRPWVVHLVADQAEPLATLCDAYRVRLIDTIDRQLTELAAIRFPGQPAARHRFIVDTVTAAGGSAAVGNWVYLPWEAKIAHLLDGDSYFEVITNRNADKITADEQRLLRTKRVGVLGLSVGGEAAVTLAQEHLCGEIVLADFDRLDLSNLNRLNAGFDELGHNKAIIAARRIAKINPYLPVIVFADGVTTETLGDFLGRLDLLVEECDNLEIKREARAQARTRGLNVVYAADERGFLSVEPYACWPELEPFHGRATPPNVKRAAFASPLEFFHALTDWMGGWDQISERSRSSLERVGETVCGYPQLASEARYAAGQIGHVARRLLLSERVLPFVGNLDLAEFLPAAPRP
jgi:tRNA threonylcarbamoyladenosine dehydratase